MEQNAGFVSLKIEKLPQTWCPSENGLLDIALFSLWQGCIMHTRLNSMSSILFEWDKDQKSFKIYSQKTHTECKLWFISSVDFTREEAKAILAEKGNILNKI